VGQTPERPETGAAIEPDVGNSGDSSLEVNNGTNLDAAIRLVETSTNTTSRFVYIRAHKVYTIEGIGPGTYSLRYALGRDWIDACRDFVRDESLHEFPNERTFEENYTTTWQVTLHGVLLGNVTPRNIDKKRFLEGDQHVSVQQ
jgi:hypothetical protein